MSPRARRLAGAAVALVLVAVGAMECGKDPGHLVAEAPASGPFQVAGQVSSTATAASPGGAACAAWRFTVDEGGPTLSTAPEKPACAGESFAAVTLRDYAGGTLALSPELVRAVVRVRTTSTDKVPAGAACPEPRAGRIYTEECLPSGTDVVVRACVGPGGLAPCGDGKDAAWEARWMIPAQFVWSREGLRAWALWAWLPLLLAGWLVWTARRAPPPPTAGPA